MDQPNIGPSRPASNGSWPGPSPSLHLSNPMQPSPTLSNPMQPSPTLSNPMQPSSAPRMKPLLWSFKAKLQGKLKTFPKSVDHTQITEQFTSWKHPGHWIVPNRSQYEAWFTGELTEFLTNDHKSELQTCFCVFVASEAEQMLPTNGLDKRPTDEAYFEWVLRRIFSRVVADQIVESILEKCQSHGVPPANCIYILEYPINVWVSQITEFLMQDSDLCHLAHPMNAKSVSGRSKAPSSGFVKSRADFLPGVEHLSNPIVRSLHSVQTGSVDMPLPSLQSRTSPESSAVRTHDTQGVELPAAPLERNASSPPSISQTSTPPRSPTTRGEAMRAVEPLVEHDGHHTSLLFPTSSQESTALGEISPAVETQPPPSEQQEHQNQNQQPERPKSREAPSQASTRVGTEPPPRWDYVRTCPPKHASKYDLACQLKFLEYRVGEIRKKRAQRKAEGKDVPDEKTDPKWSFRERMRRLKKWLSDHTKPDEPQDGSIMGQRELTQDDLHLRRVVKRSIKALLVKLAELERLESEDQDRVREASRSGGEHGEALDEAVDNAPPQSPRCATNDDGVTPAVTPQTSDESQSARDRFRSIRRRMGFLRGHGSAQRLTQSHARSQFS